LTQSHGGTVDAIRSLNTRPSRGVRDGQLRVAAAYDMNNKAWDHALSDRVTRALEGLAEQERRVIEPGYFEAQTRIEVARTTTCDVTLVDSKRGNQTETPSNKSLATNN
jgi:DNA-directed RNA polymerase specialized sigma24 family protein